VEAALAAAVDAALDAFEGPVDLRQLLALGLVEARQDVGALGPGRSAPEQGPPPAQEPLASCGDLVTSFHYHPPFGPLLKDSCCGGARKRQHESGPAPAWRNFLAVFTLHG